MPKNSDLKVCVIIPAFNEAKVIYSVISDLKTEFKRNKIHGDVVVINDRSSDDTGAVARDAGAIVIDHLVNQGAGGATSTGLFFAKENTYDIVVTMDADGQHIASDVVRGIELIKGGDADVLIGSRLIDSKGMPRIKRLGNVGLSTITKLLFGINSTDSQSGLRVFNKDAILKIEWRSTGYDFCSEMLWRAKQLNLTVRDYPIKAVYTEYSAGKGQNNWNAINIIKALVKRRLSEIFS